MLEKGLSIIIPTYNEEANIRVLIESLAWPLRTNRIPYEIIIVDDHSSDRTRRIVTGLSNRYPLKLFKKNGRKGKGYSVLQGYSEAIYGLIALIDADTQAAELPEYFLKLLSLAEKHGYACARIRRTPLARALSLSPYQGPKIFQREIFEHLDRRLVTAWVIGSPLVYTAQELGYPGSYLHLGSIHVRRKKTPLSRVTRTLQKITSAVKPLINRQIFTFKPADIKTMIGAGVAYKRSRFITHTTLPIHLSALRTFAPWQVFFLLILIVLISAGIVLDPRFTLISITATLSTVYLIDVFFNLWVTIKSLHQPPEIIIADSELAKLSSSLPVYTVLCPLYKEAEVLPQFVEAMQSLDWPKNKLEVLLLLEEDDKATIKAARTMRLPDSFRIVIVPHSKPKTKPKACNYGLAYARGEYVVIYDAEDQPEPSQLKKSYLAFKRTPAQVACLQAKLNYYNPHHNLLTRLFTTEYSLWFDLILPGLQSLKTSIPLGGTSNHFKTRVLRELQGWDPFNVTEDADLGTRLFSAGYQTAIIDSTTLEEANSDLKNWFRQRSRWLKGYMQTYLVHMKNPLKLLQDQGWHALLFQLVVGGKIAFIMINPFLWTMTIAYFALFPFVGPAIEAIYPAKIFYIAVTSLVVGNFVAFYNYMIGAAKRGHYGLIKYVFLIPFYWLAISYSAAIAFFQLLFRPHYWEKTIHGLHLLNPEKLLAQLRAKEESRTIRAHRLQRLADLTTNAWNAGGVMVLATLFANVMNFLYNAYLGRHLTLEDFGEISLFGSFMYLASVPLSALSRTITHQSGYLLGKYGRPVKSLWHSLRPRAFTVALLVAVIWLSVTPLLQRFFRVESAVPFLLFAPVWLIGTATALSGGFLSGNLLFSITAATAILESVAKFAFSAAFVESNLPGYVYAAAPLSLLIVMGVEWWAIQRLKRKKPIKKIPSPELKLSAKFYFTSILTSVTKATYLSLDLLLAKHFLNPVEAGAYSYLSLAGKMVFFLSSMFSQFLIPYVSRDLGAGKSPSRSFRQLLLLLSVVNLGAFLIFGAFGFLTAPLLWGSKAALIVRYLPAYSLAMALFSTTQVIVTYHQVRGRHLFPVLAFGLALLMGLGLYFEHHSIGEIVLVVMIASAISLGGSILMTRYYGFVVDLFHAFIDFIGLFRPLPPTAPLGNGRLRILIFNWRDLRHKWAGGAEVYLHELGKRWVRMGHEVTIFAGNDGKSARFERLDGVRLVRRGGFYLVYLWAFLYYFLRLRGRYDVIIDSENGLPFFTPLYVKEKVFLLIHHVHQEVFRKSLLPPFSYLASFLEKRVMPLVYRKTEVITVSPSSQADILLHKLTKHDPHIVYNGVDLKHCRPGTKSQNPLVLYLGRLTTAKSVHVLIRSARQIARAVPKVRFVIAGDGPARGMLTRLVQKMGLEELITFTGRVSEIEKIKLYQKAWVFVNPSLIEGWGITTIEANACGTPVVASNVAGLRDAVHNPHSGYLVPYGNVGELAETIVGLLRDSQTRKRMSRESVTWARKFAWEKSAILGESILSGSLPSYTWVDPHPSPGNGDRLKLGIALYQGQTIFVKEWSRHNRSALNEILAYEKISPFLTGRVRLPKLIFTALTGDKTILGLEYLPGRLLSSYPAAYRVKAYGQILNAFRRLPVSSLKKLYFRPVSYLLTSFLYIFLQALFVRSASYREIIRSGRQFLSRASKLSSSPLTFVHRDLNPDNILVYKRKLYVIDLQYAAVSLPEYEFAGIWRSIAKDQNFSRVFLRFLHRTYLKDHASRTRFRLLTIYYTLLGLTDRKFSRGRVKDFRQILRRIKTI